MNKSVNFTHDGWSFGYTLKGELIDLIPLNISHHKGLVEAVQDGDISNLWYARVPSPEDMFDEINRRLDLADKKQMMPFTVLSKAGKILGMTTYQTLDLDNKRVEIGYTWYRKSVQRSNVNTEAKFLLLQNAFENMNVIAVGFRTHYFNFKSRKAIERIGAKLEGVWRNHMILPDGTIRDTCYYSIINGEWQTVRTHLTWLLQQNR
ncbi:GNAT family N-acetyltransferase [Xenorhabdus doucetiae]|uniref:Acetyltransferase, GNAT family n=1 Tax=Xenorhabdus doucetiae TaxID=351671 RepID=A0A068QPF5_9GAMM|nr:GNAT family N-acetyltransferase [Xenorhabdus doucetiae]TYP16429.1 RimJ/RimL family protein N-acetyltransferase [Xenorhabdus doucetiae]CDG16917.1 Acetyltransferase, GNAT family [Xenorhabdus doucetiae]